MLVSGAWCSRSIGLSLLLLSGRKWTATNTQDHEITLWNNNNHSTPIADGTVLNSSTSDSFGIKWVAVTPVVLTPGNTYAIGVSESGVDDFKILF